MCEDQGLAAAATAGQLRISQLLQYSSVCGCGLDTVPVPGPVLPFDPAIVLAEADSHSALATALSLGGDSGPASTGEQVDDEDLSLLLKSSPGERPSPNGGPMNGSEPGKIGEVGSQEVAYDVQLQTAVAGVIGDVAALAHRLQKPLSCRLLPIPGRKANTPTTFTNPYLIDSHTMEFN